MTYSITKREANYRWREKNIEEYRKTTREGYARYRAINLDHERERKRIYYRYKRECDRLRSIEIF